MMIYIFGDLRQLRSFELARPPISSPRLIPSPPASLKGEHPAPQPPSEKNLVGSGNLSNGAAHPHPFPLGFFARLARFNSARGDSGNNDTVLPTSTGSAVVSEKHPVSVELTKPPRAISAKPKPVPPKLKIITPGSLTSGQAVSAGSCSESDREGPLDEAEPRSRWSDEIEETPRPPEVAVVNPTRRRSTTRMTDAVFKDSAAAQSRTSVTSSLTLSSDIDSDGSYSSDEDDDDDRSVEVRKPRIEVSEAYYDENPSPEGPATRTSNVPLWPDYIGDSGDEDGTTAGFIRSYIYG